MALTATQTSSERILGNGDRFFTFIRWLVLGLAFVIDLRLNNRLVIPPTVSSFALVWWGYAIFALLLSVGRFVPAIDQLMPWAFVGDLAFLSILGIVGNIAPELLYPPFIPTTIWAALRRTSQAALISGLMAAVAYIVSTLLIQRQDGAITLSNTTLLGLSINVVMLVFIAWLTSVLASHSSDTNRLEVAAAQRDVETARQEAESYRDRMRALYQVAFRLSTTMNFQTVLDATVQEDPQKIVDGTVSLVLLPTGEPDELYVAAGKGLQANDLNKRVVINPTGIIGSTFASGTPQIVDNVQISPAIQSIQSLHTITSVCCVPLSAGRRNYGLLLVGTNPVAPFRAEELEMVTALANYAIIAMLNAQLGTEIHQERVKLIDKEEQVRQQLARDLHDGPAQSVAAITMNIDFVKRLLKRDPSRVEQGFSKLGELARRTTYDIRTLLFELRPLSLDSQGLIATLRECAQRFNGPTQVIVEEAVGDLRLETKREGTVFNIVQEAVNNAMKHAQAKHIWIRLQRQGDELMATVQDDGKGFDLQAIRQNYHQRGSFGLLNIEERAQMVGGSAELNSAPGAGTTVRVIVPIDATSI